MTASSATLLGRVLPATRPLPAILAVLGGAALIALATRVQVPMWPVPMTLQTLAVMAVAMAFGARLGVAAVATYLAQGAAGLPVFASGGGFAHLAGPTAGYLWGFLAAALIVGHLADRGLGRHPAAAFALALLGSAVVFFAGWAWLAMLIGGGPAFDAGVLPFVVGDVVKAALAAAVLPLAWNLLARLG